MGLKRYIYVGVSLCRLCVFNTRTGFSMDASVLAIICLLEVVFGVVISRVCAECEVKLPLWSMVATALLMVGSAPQFLE